MATLTGTNGDDTLEGGDSNDVVKGRGGDDALAGGGGVDRLDGGLGRDWLFGDNDGEADTLVGGAGNDTLVGFASDVLIGGEDLDLLWLAFNNLTSDLQVDLNGVLGEAARTVDLGPAVGMTVSGLEAINAVCGAGSDMVQMGDSRGLMIGGAGDDTLTGGNGHDYLRGDAGADILAGGKGSDRVSFFGVAGGVDVSLLLQGAPQDTNAGLDTLIGIENVSGTAEDDVLIGDSRANWLWGAGGDDSLSGGGGGDLLRVFNGNNTVSGGSGRDTLDVSGNPTAFAAGLIVSLTKQGAAQNTGQGLLTLSSIENVTGSVHDDAFSGDGGANLLAGAWGSDTLNGGAGGDLLYGDGEVAPDTGFFGGSGPIANWEQALPNDLVGEAAGDDVLLGGAGQDRLVGGLGADLMAGGRNADVFAFLSVEDSLDGFADYLLDLSDGQDVIDMSAIDADASTEADDAFVLVADLSGAAGQADLVYVIAEDVTRLLLDVDGGGADFVLEIAGNHTGFVAFIL